MFEGVGVIEVYPAGTLVAIGIGSRGYKKREQIDRRAELIQSLKDEVELGAVEERVLASDDLLDAAICVLAGADFLRGMAQGPEDHGLARREGWIWVR
jgi:predicted nuclease with RNAse H fold